MVADSCKWVKQRLNVRLVDLRHGWVLVWVQVYSLRWNTLDHQRYCNNPHPLTLMYLPPVRVLTINQHTWQCQEVRDLQKEEHTMFLEMSLCFMAYCAAIKHLLGRQLIYQACLLIFSSSHSLRGQIPSRCCLPICVSFSGKRMNHRITVLSINVQSVPFIRLIALTVCAFCLLQGLGSSQFGFKTELIS